MKRRLCAMRKVRRSLNCFDALPAHCNMKISHFVEPWEPSDDASLAVVLFSNPLSYKRIHIKFTGHMAAKVAKVIKLLKVTRVKVEITLDFPAEVSIGLVETCIKQRYIVALTLVCQALNIPDALEVLPIMAHSTNRAHCIRLFITGAKEEETELCNAISSLVADDTALVYLEIYGYKLRGERFQRAVSQTKVKALILSDETIDQNIARKIGDALLSSNQLLVLRLSYTCLGDATVIALAENLKENKGVKKLSLMSVGITPKGAQALADMLAHNEAILEIYLGDDHIGDVGGTALAQALKRNTALRIFYLVFAGIGDRSGVAFADALTINRVLTQLYLQGDDFTEKTNELLIARAKENSVMDVLRFDTLNLLEKKPPYRLHNTVKTVYPDGIPPLPNVAQCYQMILELQGEKRQPLCKTPL